jgi:hypothetical protein
MSSQSSKSTPTETWQQGVVSTRDSSDWTALKKRRTVYTELKGNVADVQFNHAQSFDLRTQYNFGGVSCDGCTGGARFSSLATGS